METPVITVSTKPCSVCGNRGTLEVPAENFSSWLSGALIQTALPMLTADQREQLISGTHGECWDALFPDN